MEIDHIAIAVASMDEAIATFRALYGLEPGHSEEITSDNVTETMLPIGDTQLQLLAATADDSPIARFVEKRGEGLHHIAIRVPDIDSALERLKREGAELIDTEARIGGGGHRVAFVHPKTSNGVLIELVEHRDR